MSKMTIRCGHTDREERRCTEEVTIASGTGTAPNPRVLAEMGWSELNVLDERQNVYLCPEHAEEREREKTKVWERLKTRSQIDEEIVEANKATREIVGLREAFSEPTALPTDSQERKDVPMARGCLDYFPAALAEVARLSKHGNDKHNPGEEIHHARGKSSDHADCIMRHLAERGDLDTDGFLHDVKVAWRALAMLQEALETRGAPLARGAREDTLTD